MDFPYCSIDGQIEIAQKLNNQKVVSILNSFRNNIIENARLNVGNFYKNDDTGQPITPDEFDYLDDYIKEDVTDKLFDLTGDWKNDNNKIIIEITNEGALLRGYAVSYILNIFHTERLIGNYCKNFVVKYPLDFEKNIGQLKQVIDVLYPNITVRFEEK